MGILSWYGITIGAKVVMIQQNYEAITGVNYRADTKRFTQGEGVLPYLEFVGGLAPNFASEVLGGAPNFSSKNKNEKYPKFCPLNFRYDPKIWTFPKLLHLVVTELPKFFLLYGELGQTLPQILPPDLMWGPTPPPPPPRLLTWKYPPWAIYTQTLQKILRWWNWLYNSCSI